MYNVLYIDNFIQWFHCSLICFTTLVLGIIFSLESAYFCGNNVYINAKNNFLLCGKFEWFDYLLINMHCKIWWENN